MRNGLAAVEAVGQVVAARLVGVGVVSGIPRLPQRAVHFNPPRSSEHSH